MHRRIMMPFAIVMAMLMATMSVTAVSAVHEDDGASHEFADPAFEDTWARTDMPVESGEAVRTWIWGPEPYTEGLMEDYAESPGGQRLVQYFDKSRMEINDPAAVNDGLWYVTNGLLVVDMVKGQVQIGDSEFDETPEPAEVNIVGDPADGSGLGPTYADINTFGLMEEPATAEGTTLSAVVGEDGTIADDPAYATYAVTAGEQVTVEGIDHTVASVFWDFMTSEGIVWDGSQNVTEKLFENPYYATGYPVTEAYWTSALVGGNETDVLWQCFERRCLTYTPDNEAGFQVEAGNVGQHYYRWVYDTDPGPGPEPQEYEVQFGSLNGSGVSGTAQLTLTGNELAIDLQASGLEEGAHIWHVHGKADGTDAACPTIGLDTNENGFIELEEGVAAYGDVLVSLEDLVVGADGIVDTSLTVTLTDEQLTDLGDLLNNIIVIHGMTADLDGEGAGEAAYVDTLPVACGDVQTPEEPAAEAYTVMLDQQNESGVNGSVLFALDGDQLTVTVQASGLTPDESHAIALRGLAAGQAACPTAANDTDTDGFVDLEEGSLVFGDELEAIGDATADAEGNLMFETTLIVDPETLQPLTELAVVVQGLSIDPDDEGPELPVFDDLMPVACGIVEAGGAEATAEIMDATDTVIGTANLVETADGVLVHVEVTAGVAPGLHGTHIHETGICTPPDFASAGAHFNPTAATHPNHAGDLGNMLVLDDMSGEMLMLNADVTLGEGENSLFDADGSAIVIHAGSDDAMTDPGGNSGARVACGVITSTEAAP